MTREEVILCLKGMKNYARDTFTEQTDWQISLDTAIKALVKEGIIDKIIAEIEQHRRKTQSIDPYDLVGDCLDIIAKYKEESEEQ